MANLTKDEIASVTCAEFRAWIEEDYDDELIDDPNLCKECHDELVDLVDDPKMGQHLDLCKECSDWLELDIAILERERLPALMALYGPIFKLQ